MTTAPPSASPGVDLERRFRTWGARRVRNDRFQDALERVGAAEKTGTAESGNPRMRDEGWGPRPHAEPPGEERILQLLLALIGL